MVTIKVQLVIPMVLVVLLLTMQVKCSTYALEKDAADANPHKTLNDVEDDQYSKGRNGNISESDRSPVMLIIAKSPNVMMYDVDQHYNDKPRMMPIEIDCVFPNGLRIPFIPDLHRNNSDPANVNVSAILRVPDNQSSQTLENHTREVNDYNSTRNSYYSDKFENDANSASSIVVINNEKQLENKTIGGDKNKNITELVATLLAVSDAGKLWQNLNSSETVVLNYSPDDKPLVYYLPANVPIDVLHDLKNIMLNRQETFLKPDDDSKTNTEIGENYNKTKTTITGNGNSTYFVRPDREEIDNGRTSINVPEVNVSHIDTVNINVIFETDVKNTDVSFNKYNKRTGRSQMENTTIVNSLLNILNTIIQKL